MKIEIQYGNGVVPLPGAALERLTSAGEAEWRLLLLLCAPGESSRALRESFDPAKAAEQLELTEQETAAALAFWRGAGILKLPKGTAKTAPATVRTPADEGDPLPKTEKIQDAGQSGQAGDPPSGTDAPSGAQTKSEDSVDTPARSSPLTVLRSDSEVHYTGEELDLLMQKKPDLRQLLEECQHLAGKLFSAAESSKIITLADYYALSPEYILMLFQYSQTVGKCSVPYVFRTACELFRREIRQTDELEEYFRREEQRHTLTNTVRRLLGIGSRALSGKEKRFLDAWSKAGFSEELVTLAYEQTVDATGGPSLPYMNKILESWKEAGIDSPAAVQAADADYRMKKAEGSGRSEETSGEGGASGKGKETGRKAAAGGKKKGRSEEFHSFDPEEFFRVALEKSDAESARLRAEKEKKAKAEAGDAGEIPTEGGQ